jgi:hypothetical protein
MFLECQLNSTCVWSANYTVHVAGVPTKHTYGWSANKSVSLSANEVPINCSKVLLPYGPAQRCSASGILHSCYSYSYSLYIGSLVGSLLKSHVTAVLLEEHFILCSTYYSTAALLTHDPMVKGQNTIVHEQQNGAESALHCCVGSGLSTLLIWLGTTYIRVHCRSRSAASALCTLPRCWVQISNMYITRLPLCVVSVIEVSIVRNIDSRDNVQYLHIYFSQKSPSEG